MILEAFTAGLLTLLSWPNFGYLALGTALGFMVGLIPGLGGPVAIVILLPFTLHMEPVAAFTFLLAMVAVTATTGEITAILFGIPGDVTAAALVLDGHAMAKNGEAGRALGASLASSVVGALIGVFAIAAAIPLVRPVVLAFGSPEFFMLTIFGIAMLAALSREDPVRGLIAGGVGLLLATVGLDPQSATPRFTLGSIHLWAGLGIIPVGLGLFAVPELVNLAVRGTSISGSAATRIAASGVRRGIADTFRHKWLLLRCSMLGVFIGLLPGLGGATGQWMAYAHAGQTHAKHYDGNGPKFGSGTIEGIIGPGSTNNSKEGGSLVPTIAFGVPGSVTMAILLGAFIVKGFVPGPDMFTSELSLTMTFLWSIALSNVLAVIVAAPLANQFALLTHVRASIMVPLLATFVFMGTYLARNSIVDVGIMLLFGAVGYLMVTYGWPRPPMILGLVLGPLAERYFFLSTNRYGLAWTTRPIVLVLAALVVVVVASPSIQHWRRNSEHSLPPDERQRK